MALRLSHGGCGSSPRAWGTRPRWQSATGQTAVHPHARGEHIKATGKVATDTGSSPRAWGTLTPLIRDSSARRFIPTRVGNTARHPAALLLIPVHPHARGEHALARCLTLPHFGSSPRAWGTLHRCRRGQTHFRFIPTRVGNTLRGTQAPSRCSVHPHARGEHVIGVSRKRQHDGSSPRAWGTPNYSHVEYLRLRFIPTRVGNTQSTRSAVLLRPVHPHARGEHYWRCSTQCCNARFIPTRVGNTTSPGFTRRGMSVHPHARGEHLNHLRVDSCDTGSSPRAWGTRAALEVANLRQRFIPTRVGNTGETWAGR